MGFRDGGLHEAGVKQGEHLMNDDACAMYARCPSPQSRHAAESKFGTWCIRHPALPFPSSVGHRLRQRHSWRCLRMAVDASSIDTRIMERS